jgi:protochlorophyllide reductase
MSSSRGGVMDRIGIHSRSFSPSPRAAAAAAAAVVSIPRARDRTRRKLTHVSDASTRTREYAHQRINRSLAHRSRIASHPSSTMLSMRANVVSARPGARRASASSRVHRAGAVTRAASTDIMNKNTGNKPVVVITGASSGLGLYTAKALVKRDYFVVMAVRSVEKGVLKANELGFPKDSYAVMNLELGDLQSVRDFATNLRRSPYIKTFQSLVCNAALYLPNATVPSYTKDGFEECVGVNHLGHHLLSLLLLDDLAQAPDANMKRLIIVGSVTGNTNTLAGQVPPRAGLGDMSGLKNGFKNSDRNQGALIDGTRFIGAKAYKDSKLCNMLDIKAFAERYGESTGIKFSTMYPGCIADSNLFRNHTPFFRWLFPLLQKNVTKGYVSEEEAGERLASIVYDPRYNEQGAYWAWKGGGDQLWDNYNNNDDSTRTIAFNNKPSKEGRDMAKANEVFDISTELVGFKPTALDGLAKSFDRMLAKK